MQEQMEQLMRKKGDGSVQTLVDSTFLPDLEEELEALDDSSQVSITYWESRCMPLVVGVGGGGLFVGVPHPFTHLVPPQTHMRPRIRTHTRTHAWKHACTHAGAARTANGHGRAG